MFNPTLKRLAVGIGMAGALGFATNAAAAPGCPETVDPLADYKCVFINVGALGTNDGKTGNFYELGLTGTLATSIYQAGLAIGSQVVDTNRQSVINSFGFATGTYTSVQTLLGGAAQNVNLKDAPDPTLGENNIDSLNPLNSALGDVEGFNQPGKWQLTFDYRFNGTLTAGGPSFTGGDLIVYFDDLSNGVGADETVLRVNITGSTLNLANLDLFGTVSFDFDNNGSNDCMTTFCQNFWNFQTGGQSFYALEGQGTEISFHLDTNVNPPFPTLDQLAASGNSLTGPYWARQTTLDSSVRFNVPEPASLALIGMALLGVAGGAARRRSRS